MTLIFGAKCVSQSGFMIMGIRITNCHKVWMVLKHDWLVYVGASMLGMDNTCKWVRIDDLVSIVNS